METRARGQRCEVQDENEKVELGDKMDSKLEVHGGILLHWVHGRVWRSLRARAFVVLHSRRESGKRSAQARKLSGGLLCVRLFIAKHRCIWES